MKKVSEEGKIGRKLSDHKLNRRSDAEWLHLKPLSEGKKRRLKWALFVSAGRHSNTSSVPPSPRSRKRGRLLRQRPQRHAAHRAPDPGLPHQQDAAGTRQFPAGAALSHQGERTQGQAAQPRAQTLSRPRPLSRWELPLRPGDEGRWHSQYRLDGHHGRWHA